MYENIILYNTAATRPTLQNFKTMQPNAATMMSKTSRRVNKVIQTSLGANGLGQAYNMKRIRSDYDIRSMGTIKKRNAVNSAKTVAQWCIVNSNSSLASVTVLESIKSGTELRPPSPPIIENKNLPMQPQTSLLAGGQIHDSLSKTNDSHNRQDALEESQTHDSQSMCGAVDHGGCSLQHCTTEIYEGKSQSLDYSSFRHAQCSTFFSKEMSFSSMVLQLELDLCTQLLKISFPNPPVTHVYNPIEYAINPHVQFLRQYCTGCKDILFVGMNPGPFGMAQTGIPFGEISKVRDWLQISGVINQPRYTHPKKPVLGFDCQRSEVSGARFWTLIQELSGTPAQFFKHSFVHNLCPLMFLSKTGKNVSPPELPLESRHALNSACDQSLSNIVKLLNVKIIVAVGNYAFDRATATCRSDETRNISVFKMMHPSPANPSANKDWSGIAKHQLTEFGLMPYIQATTNE